MRNIAIVVLSVLLAAAIISGLFLYGKYNTTKDALQISEKKLSDLNEKVILLNQKTSALQYQIRENAEHLKELKSAKTRISELENTINLQDRTLFEFKEKLKEAESQVISLREGTAKRESEIERLESQLSELEKQKSKEILNRDDIISGLKEKVKDAESQVISLREGMAKRENEIERLESQLSDLERQKSAVKTQVDQLKSTHEAVLSHLNKEILNRDDIISGLKGKLKDVETQVISLREGTAKRESEIERLKSQLSDLQGQKTQLKTEIDKLKSTYNGIFSELKKQIQNKEVTISELEGKLSITFLDRLLFESGKATITPEGREILSKVGRLLKNVQDRQIRVVGHTDNIPILQKYRYKFPSNWELSAARAAAVIRHFQEKIDLDPANLEVVGHSFYEPVASNETEEGRAQNRRVTIIIAPKIQWK